MLNSHIRGFSDKLVYKSRFIELIGDPIINSLKWNIVPLKEVCSAIIRGPFGSTLKKEYFVQESDDTYKVYEQKNAIQKQDNIGNYYITHDKYRELKRFECSAGDILMSCSGTVGELYQLPEGCKKGIINQALCKFTLNKKIHPQYFIEYMTMTIGNLQTQGSGIKNIASVSYIKELPILLPPEHIQCEYINNLKQIDKSKFICLYLCYF
ncbi:EcoKI restriction-modification system protein HsdS [Anaerobiospirillum thomasii]|nr:EcoKI restriction-modification system protein HsdS [Anaerobiospirillum thomasii]